MITVVFFHKGEESRLTLPDALLPAVQRKLSELLVLVAEHEEQAGRIAA